jgi:hypothetical protein
MASAGTIMLALIALQMVESMDAQPNPAAAPFVNEIENDAKQTMQTKRDAETAEQSFRKFIEPVSSTVIGEIKPNASSLEMMLLRDKIASTIASMKEKENERNAPMMGSVVLDDYQPAGGAAITTSGASITDCYIEVTRREKIPGKCLRTMGGKPICQSDGLISIDSECS